jgi:hypothetical protein
MTLILLFSYWYRSAEITVRCHPLYPSIHIELCISVIQLVLSSGRNASQSGWWLPASQQRALTFRDPSQGCLLKSSTHWVCEREEAKIWRYNGVEKEVVNVFYIQSGVWFTVITSLTVGYGDVVPLTVCLCLYPHNFSLGLPSCPYYTRVGDRPCIRALFCNVPTLALTRIWVIWSVVIHIPLLYFSALTIHHDIDTAPLPSNPVLYRARSPFKP